MIHRALLGSLERFFGILIEHYAGKFPTWLAPTQCRIISLTNDADEFVDGIEQSFKESGIRYDIDYSSEKLGYKVRKAQLEKIPLVAIIGEKELKEKKLTIRCRDSKKQPILSIDELVNQINQPNIGGFTLKNTLKTKK